jgi:hypothetical protein
MQIYLGPNSLRLAALSKANKGKPELACKGIYLCGIPNY